MTTTYRETAVHPFAEGSVRVLSNYYFVADQGARYDIQTLEDGYVVAEAQNSHARYVSMASRIEVTGKTRKQPGTGGAVGRRAVLHLDLGVSIESEDGAVVADNISRIPGYVV
jgi:hypothetical protein